MDDAVLSAILADVAAGAAVRNAVTEHGVSSRTFYERINSDPEAEKRYARAREEQADALADEIIAIADEATDPQKGRLQVDARKWVAARLKPKKYGDSLALAGDKDRPLTLQIKVSDLDVL